jgi:hypothetical protein
MGNELETVKYRYVNRRFSPNAIRHAFAYISAVTGIRFTPSISDAELWRSDHGPIPNSARLLVGEHSIYQERGEPTDKSDIISSRMIVEDDPVEKIIDMLCLAVKMGPFSGSESANPKPNKLSLSSLISDLVKSLAAAGVIARKSHEITLWPDGRRFAVAVTHDVDIARRSVKGSIRLLWKRLPPGRFKGLIDSVRSYFGNQGNPYDKISEWIKIENDLGIKSTFFLFAGPRRHRDDPKYKLDELSHSIDDIRRNGFELALHSGIMCDEGESLADSRSELEKHSGFSRVGLRPHYLSAHLPEYWGSAAESGFSYSSCLGFDDAIGHLDGIDLPFVPFDREKDTAIDLVEIPIAIMDSGLIRNESAESDEVISRGEDLIDMTAESGGMIVLDWHQRTLYNPDYPGWGELFRKITDYALRKGAYSATMEQISSLLDDRMGKEY